MATLELGTAELCTWRLRKPDSTLSRLLRGWRPARALDVHANDPHPLDRSSCFVARAAEALDVSPGTDGLVQGELQIFDRSHQPCLFTLAHSLAAADNGWLLGRDRRGLSSPYHVATTYPWEQPELEVLCHADQTVPRQDVYSPFSPSLRMCHHGHRSDSTHAGSGHSRARRRL